MRRFRGSVGEWIDRWGAGVARHAGEINCIAECCCRVGNWSGGVG